MPIHDLSIENFRNIICFRGLLSPRLNILRGENAQGKTNFLEAIYYLANGKSFRVQENESLIQFSKAEARLNCGISHQDLHSQLELKIDSEGRSVKFQNKILHRFTKIHEILRVLVFTPDSTSLFRSSPGNRRRYFDHAISVQQSSYSTLLGRYTRVLAHRNRILERGDLSALPEFDSQWMKGYQELIAVRQDYLEKILPYWKQRFEELSGMKIEMNAKWESSLGYYQDLDENVLVRALREIRPKETLLRHTLLGAHRDDLRLFFDHHPIRQLASQGQQRLVVIALKLAEADLFQSLTGKNPVFLLDDLGSELDAERQSRLFKVLDTMEAQTFLTTTQESSNLNLRGTEFSVRSGSILEC